MSIGFTGGSMSEPISHVGMYSDSTPMVKTLGWQRIVDQADTMTVTGGSMAQFVTAMFLADAVWENGGKIDHLILPYIPGARQDRSNPTGDVLFTLGSVAQMINSRRFRKVTVIDPHSPVAVRLINNLVEIPLAKVAELIDKQYDGVIAADKGGKDRAEQFAKALNLPVYYGGKTRDVSDGRLTGFTLDRLAYDNQQHAGGHYLVVDDICDGGGTFNGLAAKIHEQGCSADLYVTHGIFAKGTRELRKNFEQILTTDSLEPDGTALDVTVLPVVKEA